jgi:hypothetical protein
VARTQGAGGASGYSGTPLAQKLGIKTGACLHVQGAPTDYARLLAPLPPGVRFSERLDADTDVVHLFVTERVPLERALKAARRVMRDDAVLWVSWPKKSAKLASELTEDTVRAIALPLQLVDIKVCAIDATWSGLKLVIRREHRGAARR